MKGIPSCVTIWATTVWTYLSAPAAAGQPSTATIHQLVHYYPFGLPMDCVSANDYQRWLFGDKEFDRTHGLDLYDQAARQYDPALGRFRSVDPLAEKYYPTTPYIFCAGNPLRNIDPTGNIVQATDPEMQYAIKMTLRKEDRQYVRFDRNGILDNSILSQCNSNSRNYKDLLLLSSNEMATVVNLDDKYEYIDANGCVQEKKMMGIEYDETYRDDNPDAPLNITTGETGEAGITLLPGNGSSGRNSKNENINIYIHKNLTGLGRAESFAHEAYGHAVLYIITGGDRDRSGHRFQGLRETNALLINKLNEAIKETILNNR